MRSTLAIALAFVVALTLLDNVAVAALLADLPRLTTDFSPAYLQREMASLAAASPATLVLGDSDLWGYRIEAAQGAVALLRRRGCACVDLAFKGGSPPNDYAMLRLALDAGVRPRALLLEIDDEVFDPEDRAYETLNPSLARAAAPYFSAGDRAALHVRPPAGGARAALERALGSVWLVYAMRGDLRETLLGDADPPVPPPTPDRYEGTFDLTPLTAENVGVRYLARTLDLARARGIPVVENAGRRVGGGARLADRLQGLPIRQVARDGERHGRRDRLVRRCGFLPAVPVGLHVGGHAQDREVLDPGEGRHP